MGKIFGVFVSILFVSTVYTTSVYAAPCTIRFVGPVLHETVKELLDQIEACPKTKARPLVIIESPGGDADAMQFAVNMLTDRVDTHIGYSVSSAAVTLALVGKKRTMAPNGRIYIHDALWKNEGSQSMTADISPEEMAQNAKDKENLLPISRAHYTDFVAKRTKLSRAEVGNMMTKTKVIMYDEALALGFVTK